MITIGFLTGSITQIGSGRAEALPLARGLQQWGCETYGLEQSLFRRQHVQIEGLPVWCEPLGLHLASHPIAATRAITQRRLLGATPYQQGSLDWYDVASGKSIHHLADRLDLDVLYAFHNTNVARLLASTGPHPSRVLAVNLIGFGIDPSRGGAVDTFPLQHVIFERPWWDLHMTVTYFELQQYQEVYHKLGLNPERLVYLPHPYDEAVFCPPNTESDARADRSADDEAMLLYPVNVYPRKNIEFAIEVLAVMQRTRPVRLVVTGRIWDHAYHGALLEHAHRHGVANRVEFLGGVSLERLVELYHEADATIFTSHQETYGHGIVESLGCGTPVIGPGWIIPCAEILDHSIGGQSAPRDSEAFAATVLKVFESSMDPNIVAADASQHFGNRAIAERFLRAVLPCQEAKTNRAKALRATNWKGLYCDAGDLL